MSQFPAQGPPPGLTVPPPQGPPITTQPRKLKIIMFNFSVIFNGNISKKLLFTFKSDLKFSTFSNYFLIISLYPAIIVTPAPTPLGPGPQHMTCPSCGAQIMTQVSDVATAKTHGLAIGCCLIGCVLGCCLIPYCISSCQGQRHDCPNCGYNIGMYK